MIDKECSKQPTNEIEGKYSNKTFDLPRDRIKISSYAGNQSNKSVFEIIHNHLSKILILHFNTSLQSSIAVWNTCFTSSGVSP